MKNELRILHLDYSVGFGGATKAAGLILRQLDGVRPYVLTSQSKAIWSHCFSGMTVFSFRRFINYRNRARLAATFVGPYRRLAGLALKGFALMDVLAIALNSVRIAWLIKTRRIALVHLGNGFGPIEAMIASRVVRVPFIAHLRGFVRAERLSYAARWAAMVLGDSESVSATVPSELVPRDRVRTIHEPVDVAAFDAAAVQRGVVRTRLGIEDGAVAVGMFGRIVEWKGQLEFVRAMLKVMSTATSTVGVIVGDESDGGLEYFTRVKEEIDRSGFRDRFVLTGYVSDVEAYYAAMDVVVHASVSPEPCGMVVLEAMAAKRPIVAADRGGPPELVRDGADGLLVNPVDVDQMATAILTLVQDPQARVRMGLSGYQRVRARFDVGAVAARVRGVYEEVLLRSKARERVPGTVG